MHSYKSRDEQASSTGSAPELQKFCQQIKGQSLPVQCTWLKSGNQNKLLNEKGRNTNFSGIHFNSYL